MSVSVNIKMYRVGELGDCFLLSFTNQQEKSHVLIDCGSFRNGKKSIDRMKAIAEDIMEQTSEGGLNVVVGTHQHNDHLSGFVHAKKTFEKIDIGQVWLSWLDDPTNEKAVQIGTDYNNYLTGLRQIHAQLKRTAFANTAVAKNVDELMGFFGVPENGVGLNAKTEKFPPALPAEARDILRKLGRKNPKYLTPGDIISLPGLTPGAVKVYVLGPPTNDKLLYDKDPKRNETYDPELASRAMQATRFVTALKKLSEVGQSKTEEEPYPFNEPYSNSENYDAVWDSYYKKGNEWRQIDVEWLNQAEELALWLDSYTNNSSLVLAFELVASGKVLLFAADAQTGNWNSWKELTWKKKPKDFNWLNLVKNTVFYKAGHHGSHNSTLVEGLNNMTHEELVTMIPVDKSDPNITKKNGWKMPAMHLFEELKKRTKNRVILMDEGFSKSTNWNKLPNKPSGNDMYWEYEVKE